jgi:hypothetical protein
MKNILSFIKLSAIILLLLGETTVSHAQTATWNWKITKSSWSVSDEKNYSDWVKALGESGCNTIGKCLKSPANIYRNTDPADASFYSDCADLPYVLRAYFAWKNGLPFTYTKSVSPVGSSGDVRYSKNGNRPSSKNSVLNVSGQSFPNFKSLIRSVTGDVSSAMYRIAPEYDSETLPSDMYSVDIKVGALRPGSVIYDPNGHVAVIYAIEKDGRLKFMDAHPDNSLTRGTYGEKFARSRPAAGAGFKNWRPVKLVGFQNASGVLVGGRIVSAKNSQIPDYSTKQFYGTHPAEGSWSKGKFILSGTELPYYDYVRAVMSGGNLRFQPLEEVKNMVDALCADLQDRVAAVNNAVAAGIQNKEHPSSLPNNIYGTYGEWEEYSSPSRDARLKTSFKELYDSTLKFMRLSSEGSSRIDYSGNNLKGDLLNTYANSAAACSISYTNSNGQSVALAFEDVVGRLFALSFDPYHCVERRWGATSASDLTGCRDNSIKTRWYNAEQKLRNQIERTYDSKMGYSLESYESGAGAQLGVANPPQVNLRNILE